MNIEKYYTSSEIRGISNYINELLKENESLKTYLPINPNSEELFDKVNNGVVICNMINTIKEGLIPAKNINSNPKSMFHINENLNASIKAADSLGIKTVNIGATDIRERNITIVLGLLWQFVKLSIEKNIRENIPEKLKETEIDDKNNTKQREPFDILLKWINSKLEAIKYEKKVENFENDLKSGMVYYNLFKIIYPSLTPDLKSTDNIYELIIDIAKTVGIQSYIQPDDIKYGVKSQNMIFCSQIFSANPAKTDEVNLSRSNLTWNALKRPQAIMLCFHCKKDISPKEKFIRYHVTNNFYHVECFSCVICRVNLFHKPFREFDNKLYCPKDYDIVLGTCTKCGQIISSKSILINGLPFHDTCLSCCECKEQLNRYNTYVSNKKLYCYNDYIKEQNGTCFKCKKLILNVYFNINQYVYHIECFKCCQCNIQLDYKSILIDNGNTFCANHYPRLTKCCASCKNEISTQPIQALGSYYHSNCFKCHHCKVSLDNNKFGKIEVLNKSTGLIESYPLCENDYNNYIKRK